MNRRQFLAASAVTAAGCGRPPAPPPTVAAAPPAFDADAHRQLVGACPVPAGATRTTPPAAVDVLTEFPELKARARVAVRLHPRFSADPLPADATKVGGPFAWPASEPWPPGFAGVLQLRAEDAPTGVAFRPGTDLMQLLWEPPAGSAPPTPRLVWRTRAKLGGNATAGDPPPFPCAAVPERVTEYPPPVLMPQQMRERLAGWKPPAGGGPDFFADQLAAAPGTKVGGWPRWSGDPRTPTCPTCKRLTDFLLTVDSAEWDDRTKPRWQPVEERTAADPEGYRIAAGLKLGSGGTGRVHVFVCRTCEDWPAFAANG